MKAKDKAKELFDKFKNIETDFSYDGGYNFEKFGYEDAKQCALICVMEQIEEHSCFTLNNERWEFWQEVKQEINNI